MASLLLASGAKELRHALPHSRIMVHQPHGGASVISHRTFNCFYFDLLYVMSKFKCQSSSESNFKQILNLNRCEQKRGVRNIYFLTLRM